MVFAFLFLSVAAVGILYVFIRGACSPKSIIVDVVGALDGRTIEILREKKKERVILAGVGFPPGDQKSEVDCAQVVNEVIVGRRLFLEICKEVEGCRYVLLKSSNGDCINTMLLSKGLARYETSGIGYVGELVAAENLARAQAVGIWDKNRALFKHISREPVPTERYSDDTVDAYFSERD